MAINSPRTIFITGASSGIGAATALAAVEEGFQAVGVGSRPLEKIPQALQCLPPDRFVYIPADVADPAQIAQVAQGGIDRFTNLGVVNVFLNAGVFAADNAAPNEVQRMFDVNVNGTRLMANVFSPIVRASGGGFVTSSSIVAAENLNIPNAARYRETKQAVADFIFGMHQNPEYQGIRGGVVYIGASPTGMTTREGELIMGLLMAGAISTEADPTIRNAIFNQIREGGVAAESQNLETFLRAFLGNEFDQLGQARDGISPRAVRSESSLIRLMRSDHTLSSGRSRMMAGNYFISPGEIQSRVNQLLVSRDIAVAPETVARQVVAWISEGLPKPGAPESRRIYSVNGAEGPVQGLLRTFSN